MLKKVTLFIIILTITLLIVVPINASPSDVILDQQVELAVPGEFSLLDSDQNQKPEAIQFEVDIKAFQEGNFIIAGNLEAMKDGDWLVVGTTVVPFEWKPDNTRVKLTFYSGDIQKMQLDGPFRVSISVQDENWSLPQQIAGLSPAYSWKDFENLNSLPTNDDVASSSQAKRAAETWANLNNIKLGKLLGIKFNYDMWQVDYQDASHGVLRFVISPAGKVDLLKIK